MMLKEILDSKAIQMNLTATNKDEAIEELVTLICDSYGLKQKEDIVAAVQKREKLGSTGMGQGIAIPHCKMDAIDEIYLAVGISREGIDFKALDGEPVYIFFILIAPSVAAGPHLKALARITRLLRDEYFCRSIQNADSVENIHKIIITDDEKAM